MLDQLKKLTTSWLRAANRVERIQAGMVFAVQPGIDAAFPGGSLKGRGRATEGLYRKLSSEHKGDMLHGEFQGDFEP